MLRKLRIKFVCINMIIVTVMLCIIFGLILSFTRNNLEQQSIQMMQELAANPWHVFAPNESHNQIRLPYILMQIDDQGELLATGGSYFDLSDRQFLKYLLESSVDANMRTGLVPEYNLRYCRIVTPLAQYVIFADITNEINTMDNLLQSCIVVGIIAFLAFLFISILLARWAVKPVEQAWNQQKRFIADASHELKIPLAVITTNSELLQMENCTDAERQESTSNILAMARQMRSLVDKLLNLAQIDGKGAKVKMVLLNYSKLIKRTALSFEAMLYEKELTLSVDVEEGISVKGNEEYLAQVVEIFLDNVQKYATPGTEVKLKLARMTKIRCVFSVASEGEAISEHDLKKIFQRFYRVDTARKMDQSYGLGLSIAKEIINIHKGKIWAESQNGTNTFFVELFTFLKS